jgi:nucleotide-binding universal stress UspA family protein
MKNILLAIDFNDGERILIDKALEWAKAFGAKIWMLHVASPEPEFVGFGVGPQYIRDSMAAELKKEHKMLFEYANQIKSEGVDADGLLIKGMTTDMIMKEADKLNIDLIITGHQDHSLLYKLFFGSVAAGVVRKTKIPVLLIPLDERV